MASDEYRTNRESESSLVLDFLSIPIRSLDERVNQIEREICARLVLNEQVASDLEITRCQIKKRLQKAEYLGATSMAWGVREQIRKLDFDLANTRAREMESCSRELSRLYERLSEAKEALARAQFRERTVSETPGEVEEQNEEWDKSMN